MRISLLLLIISVSFTVGLPSVNSTFGNKTNPDNNDDNDIIPQKVMVAFFVALLKIIIGLCVCNLATCVRGLQWLAVATAIVILLGIIVWLIMVLISYIPHVIESVNWTSVKNFFKSLKFW